ncbi:MAG: hypothetical protein K2Q26_02120 [Bdellovibrionales bacterium]|nr:hypothetical protein [Bdellovibrionales bacterium]
MSEKIARNLVVYPLMILAVVLQVYFAMILMTVPALAQDDTSTTKVESQLPKKQAAVIDTRAVAPQEDDVDKTNKIQISLSSTTNDGEDVGAATISNEEKKEIRDKIRTVKQLMKTQMNLGEDTDKLEATLAELIEKKIQHKKRPRTESEIFYEGLDDILVPIFLFLTFAGVFGAKYYFAYRTRREQLDLYRLAIEKGQPIPADVFATSESKGRSWQDEMSRGIKFVLVGLGLALFFQTVGAPWAIGAVFTFIGLGQLGSAYIKKNSQPQK